MPEDRVSADMARIADLARLGEGILALVRESGLAKPRRRRRRAVAVTKATRPRDKKRRPAMTGEEAA